MSDIDYTTLSNEELLKAKKTLKSTKILNSVLIGFMVGVAVFAYWKKGFGFAFIFPVFLGYLLYKASKKTEILEAELKKRNL
ncbi:hypothetical protein SAMN05660477_02441 [Soonwooa buanensis]|uniref:FUSC family protein n=1 Tax=Soonwooa buanensis TaxID=619805 RepID=A0A1T5G0P5_9FLAO|nr:hypothetical protein [Soonwooa buanensis]SKC01940.1 hypothetical protein SAMN05660477_02441 [Soonwooa buanensis]